MITATVSTSSGQTITLEGDAHEIGAALAAFGGAPLPIKRGPGRPPKADTAAPGSSIATPHAKARKPVSAAVAKTRKLQGQYLGALRTLPATDKRKVQAITKEKGVPAGLAAAQKLRPKS